MNFQPWSKIVICCLCTAGQDRGANTGGVAGRAHFQLLSLPDDEELLESSEDSESDSERLRSSPSS